MKNDLPQNQKLEACVRRISSSGDLPAFANDICELLTTVADKEASLSRLANIILRNVSLTTKLLRLVNSAYFNRTGRQILSVSTAVTVLGWNTIRDLASGLMLFDKFQKQSSGVKEMILLSLLTANHARELSHHVRFPRIEEAYLCGMFSSLGELLAAFYMPDEYLHILELMKEQNLREWEACTQTLGFRYEDLGRAMVQHWKLPEKLSGGMAQVEHFTSRTSNEADMLSLITAVSRSLSFAVYRDGPEEGTKKIDFLLNRFGSALHLNGESLNSVLRDALTETKELFAVARVPLEDLRLDRHIENAMASILPGVVESAQPVVPAVINELTIQETHFSDLSREVELVLDSAEDYPLNDLIMMILEAIFRGVQCDRVLFCLLEQDRSHVRGRMGIGEGAEELLADFRFPVSLLSGPVGSAVVGKKDVIVDDVELSRYHQSQFVSTVGARAFAVCPLIIDNIAIGCFYLDQVETPLKVSDRTREILFRLRDRAAQIIEQKRRQA